MKFQPINDRICVRRDTSDETTAGGIVIPDIAKKKPQKGTVVAVGPGKLNESSGERTPVGVKAGDRILFGAWSGEDLDIDGEKVIFLAESQVLAVIS